MRMNMQQLGVVVFTALMFALAGFASWRLLDLPVAGIALFATGLICLTLAWATPTQPEQPSNE